MKTNIYYEKGENRMIITALIMFVITVAAVVGFLLTKNKR